MPRPCSADLRERALAACERRDGSRAEIARRFFSVAEATPCAWLGQAREEGRAALEGALADRRDATRRDATRRSRTSPTGWPRAPAGGGALRRCAGRSSAPGLAAQKKTLRAAERDRADVGAERAAPLPPS
jgi:transposase-like protein